MLKWHVYWIYLRKYQFYLLGLGTLFTPKQIFAFLLRRPSESGVSYFLPHDK